MELPGDQDGQTFDEPADLLRPGEVSGGIMLTVVAVGEFMDEYLPNMVAVRGIVS